MSATHRDQENRLSDNDRAAMAARVTETVRAWPRPKHAPQGWAPSPGPTAIDALVRIAASAIGCSGHDLREVELTEIREMVVTLTTPQPSTEENA